MTSRPRNPNRLRIALALTVCATLAAGCPTRSPAVPERPAMGSGGDSGEGSVAAQPADGSTPPSVVSGGLCDMVIDEGGTGAVTCPEGCVLVTGAPVLEDVGCALVGPRFEVALACLRPPMEVTEPGACYRNEAGIHVVTALRFGGLADAGWTECASDSRFSSARPCTSEQLAAAREPRPVRLRATGELVEEGSR